MEEGKFCAGQSEKKPTGILKDLSELKRYSVLIESPPKANDNGFWIKRSDVEAIINKYLNP